MKKSANIVYLIKLTTNYYNMKKYILTALFFAFFTFSNAQDWSNVYREVEEVTLNEGLKEEYVKFESFWKTIKEKH